jgi:N-acetylmuramic acid 6-phosphate etherase
LAGILVTRAPRGLTVCGFDGMAHGMLEKLLTEQANPASENIDALTSEGVLRVIHAEDLKVAAAITPEIPNIAKAVDVIVEALQRGGRLFYLGAGTSGRLGVLDASECPPTFSVPRKMVQGIIAGGEPALTRAVEASEDDSQAGGRDLQARGFGPGDVLVGIAASGRTPYVLGAAAFARELGARTVGIRIRNWRAPWRLRSRRSPGRRSSAARPV